MSITCGAAVTWCLQKLDLARNRARAPGDEDMGDQFGIHNPKRSIHEIPRACVTFGEMIGHGAFGIVIRGRVTTQGGIQRDVAIKKYRDVDVDSIRVLITELKILDYISAHENIVEFVGAITENVPAPLIVLEYCEYGSLAQVLRVNRTMFLDQVLNDGVDPGFTGTPGPEGRLWVISTSNLVRWSMQIAVYLSEVKNVIHGDLFLKSVLINGDGVAKMSDFGLSRRFSLKDKAGVRITKGFFPLSQFLPPEMRPAPSPMRVSHKMDVWTFGILLWEIFTLGREPNCTNSAEELLKPEYATTGIHSIMRSCWALQQANRPTFSTLKGRLSDELGLDPDFMNMNEIFDFSVNFVPGQAMNE